MVELIDDQVVMATIAKYVHKRQDVGKLDWYNFQFYDLLIRSDDCKIINKSLEERVFHLIDEIDCFIPIPKSGIPIASWLQYSFLKPLIIFEQVSGSVKDEFCKCKNKINFCFVDDCINSNGTLDWYIQQSGISPSFLFVLFYNDLWPMNSNYLDQLIVDGHFISLCKASELRSRGLIN